MRIVLVMLVLTCFGSGCNKPRTQTVVIPDQQPSVTVQPAPGVATKERPAGEPADIPTPEDPPKPMEGTPASEGLPMPKWPAWADNDSLAEEQIKKINAMAVTKHAKLDFEITPFGSDKPKQLSAHFGKPLVVIFWATWCDSCAEEFLILKKSYKTHKDQVNFLGVALDREDDPPGFIKRAGVAWPNAYDTGAVSKLAVVQTPRMLFINSDGRLVVDFEGAMTPKAVEAAINKLR